MPRCAGARRRDAAPSGSRRHLRLGSAAAVDRDRERIEEDLVGRIRQVALEPLEHEPGAGGRCEQPPLDLVEGGQHDQLLLERPREAAVAQVPAVELLQEAEGPLVAELPDRLAHEQEQLRDDLIARRVAGLAHDLRQHPRVSLRCPPDHHRGGAGRREHRLRPCPGGDVPGGDHRHVDELHQLGGQRVVGGPRVHLPRRARVQRQRRGAGLDQAWADVEARPGAVRDAAAHLHGDGQRDRTGDGLDQPAGVIGVVEQRGARAGLGDLLDRAAEVHVDDVGAGRLDDPGGLGHGDRVRPEDLDRQRALVRADPQVPEGALVAVLDPGDRDHLGADEAGPEPPSLAAKGLHADPGHRRQDEPAGDLDAPDPPVLPEVDVHGS